MFSLDSVSAPVPYLLSVGFVCVADLIVNYVASKREALLAKIATLSVNHLLVKKLACFELPQGELFHFDFTIVTSNNGLYSAVN